MKMMSMVVVALLAGPAAAFAQEEGVRGTWSATFSGGASLPAGGEFHEGGSGTVLGLATSVDAKTNADVFDPGVGWRAGHRLRRVAPGRAVRRFLVEPRDRVGAVGGQRGVARPARRVRRLHQLRDGWRDAVSLRAGRERQPLRDGAGGVPPRRRDSRRRSASPRLA